MLRVQSNLPFSATGVIRLDALDFNGKVLSIKLVNKFGEYLISDNLIGEGLIKHLNRLIHAHGYLVQEPDVTYFEVENVQFINE